MESQELRVLNTAERDKNIQTVRLDGDEIARAVQRIAGRPWWGYVTMDLVGEIAVSKVNLAARLDLVFHSPD